MKTGKFLAQNPVDKTQDFKDFIWC